MYSKLGEVFAIGAVAVGVGTTGNAQQSGPAGSHRGRIEMTKWILAGALALAVSGVSAGEPKKVKRAPKAAPSGQIVCKSGICRPVAPGCHLEQDTHYLTTNVEVCK